MVNAGKIFENDFISSVPPTAWHYRLRDTAGTWQGGEGARFSISNICDFILFNQGNLFLLELKSHKGKSLPFSCIKEKHLEDLVKANEHQGIHSYMVINFRDTEETYAVYAHRILKFMQESGKKSIPISYCRDNGLFIPQEKKKVHYRYGVDRLIGGVN